VGESNLVEDIRALLDERDASDLAVLERTLTDGYAEALSIEAERSRIRRRIGEVTAAIGSGDPAVDTKELASLAQRLEASDGDLAMLRRLLASLRARVDAVRTTAAAGRA
jgi:hypothetical protein